MGRPENIIFDLDGTLVDSSPGVILATNYALEKFGQKPRTDDEIKAYIGYPLEIMFADFCDAPLDQLAAAFQEKGRGEIVDMSLAIDGADEVLSYFKKAGFRLAIATTKYSHHTRGIVEKFGWQKYIAVTASGDEVTRVKPAPDIIELALKRLNAVPGETVMVGDTVNDILAAREAGVKVIAVKSPFGHDDPAAYHPNYLLENLSELMDLPELTR